MMAAIAISTIMICSHGRRKAMTVSWGRQKKVAVPGKAFRGRRRTARWGRRMKADI
jgi:hypothetical protein